MSDSETEAMDAVEVLKEEVLGKLRQVEEQFLTETCTELGVTIPARKAKRKSALINLIVTHLSSPTVEESDDFGASVLNTLKTKLDTELGTPINGANGTVKVETTPGQQDQGKQLVKNLTQGKGGTSGVSSTPDPGAGSSTSVAAGQVAAGLVTGSSNSVAAGQVNQSGTRFRADIKLKEFKIHSGTIGGENQLDLDEVIYQINEGKALGYGIREIVSGVIRATKPGSSLRKYCQTREDLTFDSLISLLRSHYGTEDSQEMVEEMRRMKQEPAEKVVDYVRRVMAIRNRILEVNKKEEHDIGEAVVRKACFRTISLGLRRDTIRLQIQQILDDISLDDDSVLERISDVAALDKKHLRMLNPGGAEACNLNTEVFGVNQVNAAQSVDNILLAQVAQSLTAHVNELAAMRTRLDQMEQRWGNQQKSNEGEAAKQKGKNVRFNFNMKCANCEQNKLFCVHCAKCGKEGHKRKDCPEN